MSILDYLDQYVWYMQRVKGLQVQTIINCCMNIRFFEQYLTAEFGLHGPEIITKRIVYDFIEKMSVQWSPHVLQERTTSVQNFVDMLEFKQLIPEKILIPRMARRKQIKELKVVDRNNIDKLIEYAKKETDKLKRIRNLVIINLLYKTGVRAIEAVQFRIDDVINNDKVIVRRKGGRQDYIFISKGLKSLIEEYKKVRDEYGVCSNALLISATTHMPINSKNLCEIVRRLGECCGIKVSPHMLRHSHITEIYKKTNDIMLAVKSAGHSNTDMTYRYIDYVDEERKNTCNLVFG